MIYIYSYYLEIKNRLLLLLFSWISTILVSYCFKEILLFIITKQSVYSFSPYYFIFTNVTEIFSVYMTLILFLGNQVLIFYSFYHMLVFIALGLYKSEYNYLVFVYKISILFFLFSVVMFNKVLFPFSWDFFLGFQSFSGLKSLTLHFEAKLNEYLTFYITFYYICILYFQTFVLLVLFFDYIKNELDTIKNFRKIFYYFFVIFSTIVTPPDIISQFVLSSSIIVSYEILLFCVFIKNLVRQPIETN